MKIRSGFVSNSSSSSFVVQVERYDFTDRETVQIVSQDEIDLLIAYGFKWTDCQYASVHEAGRNDKNFLREERQELDESLCMRVTCNQDFIIAFLVHRNIPFSASCHYGHYSVFFGKDSKKLLFVDNPGMVLETYYWDGDSVEYGDMFYDRFKDVQIRSVQANHYENLHEGEKP